MLNETRKVLVSGASFAGLSSAYWMRRLGYEVTVVEAAKALRTGGTAVNIEGPTVAVAQRMGILDRIRASKLGLERWEFKNADDVTEGAMESPPGDTLEIERDLLLGMLFDLVKDDVDLVFGESITALHEADGAVEATFRDGTRRAYAHVLGCDGAHSNVRRLWFGPETAYAHDLGYYFAIAIVERSLIRPNTAQMFNVPGKCVGLNAYKNKTDIMLAFASDEAIPYDHRDAAQQRRIIAERFAGLGWRTEELLDAMRDADNFYFDKLCQVRMPSWSKGRVVLVGDAGYCASPAAGKGGSLALDGAAALADALAKHPDDFARAFAEYESGLRPYIEEVHAGAVQFGLEHLCPRTEEAIRARNTGLRIPA